MKKNKQSGFTLLEIVIVITIMGFLLAMIAPKLGNIGKSSVETIDKSNIKSLNGYVMLYQQDKARLPNKPITVVNSKSGGNYQMPLIDDGDAENGPETIGYEFNERCKPYLHTLSKAEASELKRLGIRRMAVLNDYRGSTNSEFVKDDNDDDDNDSELKPQTFDSDEAGRPFNLVNVEEGLGVLMCGARATSETGKIKSELDRDDEIANPEFIYRIFVGVGKDCSLVTDGMVQDEGISPRGMQNKDFNTFNNYLMVLPRLKSSIDRLKGGGELKEIEVTDAMFDEEDEKAEQKIVDLGKAQEIWEVDVCSPLGFKSEQSNVNMWKITKVEKKF